MKACLTGAGHLLDVDRIAPGLAEQRHQAAVAGIDVHRLLQLDVAQRLDVRAAWGRSGSTGVPSASTPARKRRRKRAAPSAAGDENGASDAGFRLRVSWPRSIEERRDAESRCRPGIRTVRTPLAMGDGVDRMGDLAAWGGCQLVKSPLFNATGHEVRVSAREKGRKRGTDHKKPAALGRRRHQFDCGQAPAAVAGGQPLSGRALRGRAAAAQRGGREEHRRGRGGRRGDPARRGPLRHQGQARRRGGRRVRR